MKLELNISAMLTSARKSLSDWSWWSSMGQIVFGCLLVAIAFVVFINPYNMVPGGIYGLALVLHNLFPSVQVGTFGYIFDVPLILTALLIFGGKFGGRTIFASFVTPGLMNILDYLVYPNAAAIEALDPTLLMGGVVDLSNHLMLAAIIGGCFSGVGVGIVIRNNAATGGTDITGMLLHKFAKMKFANGVLLSDAIIVLSGLVVIGFGVGLPRARRLRACCCRSTREYVSLSMPRSWVTLSTEHRAISCSISSARTTRRICATTSSKILTVAVPTSKLRVCTRVTTRR